MPAAPRFLAIETSTDALSIALGTGVPGDAAWAHHGPGGAQASLTLLPAVRALMAEAGWALHSLDAIVFGRGPGSFTGLRTACAVAQGLAYGTRTTEQPHGLPVLAVDTLLALAEEARRAHADDGQPEPGHIAAVLDARMDELYVAVYACHAAALQETASPRLCAPGDLVPWLAGAGLDAGHTLLAGHVVGTHATDWHGMRRPSLPTADALLRLAPALLTAGAAVAAHEALPLYVRDKVARTTAERERSA